MEGWRARFPAPTLGDAILDRLVHNAYWLELRGGPDSASVSYVLNRYSRCKDPTAECMMSRPAPLIAMDWNRCPSSIGAGVHHRLESVSILSGIRTISLNPITSLRQTKILPARP